MISEYYSQIIKVYHILQLSLKLAQNFYKSHKMFTKKKIKNFQKSSSKNIYLSFLPKKFLKCADGGQGWELEDEICWKTKAPKVFMNRTYS